LKAAHRHQWWWW